MKWQLIPLLGNSLAKKVSSNFSFGSLSSNVLTTFCGSCSVGPIC